MTKIDFTIRFVKEAGELRRLSETLIALPRFALDIETADWWNRNQERIALIQFAYRSRGKIKVVILDALADLDLESLRSPLEHVSTVKIVHNAGFDAARLEKDRREGTCDKPTQAGLFFDPIFPFLVLDMANIWYIPLQTYYFEVVLG